ncbi:uncharacterized protein CG3556 isoform X2 [Parasteatoda tepidariorum]|uniref:uncharacterized protein CG3556 isoform X2 n=1 Tax=Parasteatoda tepidariorum TaxID=114398 RepID=UPI001C726ED1|nr:uncharacterized protein CG3556 isoform X1 [Parasteatoda tepidariorum]
MLNSKYFFICPALLFLQACSVYSSCIEKKGINEIISDSYNVVGFIQYHKCWKVLNPAKNIIHFRLRELHLLAKPLTAGNLTIMLKDERTNHTYWTESKSGNITTISTDIEIHFKVNSGSFPNNYKANFTLYFEMEVGIAGIEDVRSNAVTWLKNQRSPFLDWKENTLRAITALYLSGNATYNGTDVREELLIRRAEFLVSRALQRNEISEIDLSSYINFLRVTCNSPRHFASYDLIQLLRSKLESSGNFTHPSVYLALCNANEKWPQRAVSDLTNVLTSTSEYLFVKDIQSFALMAISCKMTSLNTSERGSLLPIYIRSISNLKQKQLSDGSFGDIYETAIGIQTLISSGNEFAYDWNSRAAVRYITNQLNSSEVDFQAIYLSLPLLNRKSLADIAERNCSGNPRNNEDSVDELKGSKIEVPEGHVRYSLFIGDKKELIRTITFQIPDNFTAYQVMLMAEVQDLKYKFLWKSVSGKMYVQEISQIPNNPENGKFWLLYLGSNSRKPLIPYFNKGPDEVKLMHGDHLIMWYKTIEI